MQAVPSKGPDQPEITLGASRTTGHSEGKARQAAIDMPALRGRL